MRLDSRTVLFHIMLKGQHVVILRMDWDGSYDVFLPGKSVEQAWPLYSAGAPYIKIWMDNHRGQPLSRFGRSIAPGDEMYPQALAETLSADAWLSLWAYVTPVEIFVSLEQIARAMQQRTTATLRSDLETRGLRFRQAGNAHIAPLGQVAQTVGPEIADHILLYPHQAADFLGVSKRNVGGIVKRLGIAWPGSQISMVEWGKLRRVRRTAPRGFVFEGKQ